MGTLGRSTRNGRQSASRRAGRGANPYKVKYAAALRELREAAEQQAATAEVLSIVSSSARDPQAVFDVILKSAMRLCDAQLGLINEWNGPAYRTVAQRGAKGAFAKWLFDRGEVKPPSYSTPMRMMQAKRPVQFDDLGKSEAYRRGSPAAVRFVDDAGVRTYLAVPLLRQGEVIGAIVLYRLEVRPFTPRQVALVKTFADQAVIAIENARLFNETKSALARQTATAEILRVLGGSMTDAQPVFDAIVKNCHELFKECGVVLRLAANGELHPVATIGATPASVPIDRKSAIGTCTLDGRTVHLPDLEAAAKRFPRIRQLGLKYGYRSGMYAPLMHKGRAIGAIGVLRRQPGAFDEKDVQLLNTFADQAVIAIENVRLFNETNEALAQQTAAGEILRVMASSPSDVQPVFDAIARNSSRLCNGDYAIVTRFDGELLHLAAQHNPRPNEAALTAQRFPRRPGRDLPSARALLERGLVHIPYADEDPDLSKELLSRIGAKSFLAVPMLKDGVPVGTIGVSRAERGPFPSTQVELMKLFADQAVIAIENVRLFNETKEALERQTATSEVLRVISRTPADAQPVFEAIAQSAVRLFDAPHAGVVLVEGESLRLKATSGKVDPRGQTLIPFDRTSTVGRALLEKEIVDVPDTEAPGAPAFARSSGRLVGFRAVASAPMLRDGKGIGAIMVQRARPGALTTKQRELLQTFADQAVIAIENARLFNETEEALERQTATAEILKVIAGSPTEVQPVFDVIVERAVRLCGARFGRVYRYDGSTVHMVASHGLSSKGLGEVQRVFPRPAADDTIAGRVILKSQPYFVEDIERDNSVPELSRKMIEALGTRRQLTIPMLRAGEPIGAITIGWQQPAAFDEREAALLKTFADQAVIAIENVRLFNETKEALDHQQASADILRIVSQSVADSQPAFEAILAAVLRLFAGFDATVWLLEQDRLVAVAVARGGPSIGRTAGHSVPATPDHAYGIAVRERRPVQIDDVAASRDINELSRRDLLSRNRGAVLLVPFVQDSGCVGAISVSRSEPYRFSGKEVALLKNFAAQAVIAIENARLFNETREALERQTATADILGVISSSPSDLQPVFDSILANATRLCNAHLAILNLYDGEGYRTVAHKGGTPEFVKWVYERGRFIPPPTSWLHRLAFSREPFRVADMMETPEYKAGVDQVVDFAKSAGARAYLTVPLLKDETLLGTISIYRPEIKPFTDKDAEVVKTFANQAVIAIENVRLFNETKEALEQQTATGRILQVISSTPADTQPVFEAIVHSAARLMSGKFTALLLPRGPEFFVAAPLRDKTVEGAPAEVRTAPLDRSKNFPSRVILDGEVVHIPDWEAEGVLEHEKLVAKSMGFGSGLLVPLLRDGQGIGALVVSREAKGSFHEKEIALLRSFADQAVIAIENARLFNETKEALERQTATAEILKVISGSPTDVQPVFDAIARSAVILCSGMFGAVFRYDGEQAHFAAHYGFSEEARELTQRRYPRVPQGLIAPTIFEGVVSHSPDTRSDSRAANPELHRALGVRGFLGVPMLLEGRPIGCICVFRREPGPFADAQIAVLQTFADQAVIAIENVRLFNETTEALEQQTATAEILKVISSTPTDTQPVFDAIAKSVLRIFGGMEVSVGLLEGDVIHIRAGTLHSTGRAGPGPRIPLGRDTCAGLAILDRAESNIADIEAPGTPSLTRERGRQYGWRSIALVPMLREGVAIGHISVHRDRPVALDDKQFALLRTFANQAVIAIENARLFNETKEALERQTATAEILKVIAGSPSDTQPVFDAIVKSAVPLFQGVGVSLRLVRGERIETVAFAAGPDCGQTEEFTKSPFDDRSVSGRAVMRREVIDVRDVFAEEWVSEDSRKIAERMGWRAIAAAALLRENEALGTLVVTRAKPTPFSQKEITLLRTFADQAVIAIENVRLFNETREALERQTATAEILKVISASPTDVQPVFDAIAERAAVLCGAKIGVVTKFDGELLHLVAFYGASPDLVEPIRAGYPVRPGGDTVTARAVRDCAPAQIPDLLADPDYVPKQQSLRAGYRSNVAVPLLREGKVIGALSVARAETGVFSEKEVGLLQTFADQAVIAIENVRLFNETKEALEQQTATAEILKVISSTPTDTQPVFDAIASSALRIFGGMDVSVGLVDGDAVHIRAGTLGSLGRGSPRIPLTRDSCAGRAALDCAEFNIADIEEPGTPAVTRERGLQNGWRSIALVPMLREGRSIGHISVHRERAAALDDKQFALLKTFANQAVIAIENTRLFNELEARTQALTRSVRQLMALGEVGQAIGSTLELETVLKTIVTHAVKLSGVHAGIIYEYHETRNAFDLRASEGFDEESLAGLREAPIRVGVGAVGRAVATRTPTAVPDTHVPEYPRRFRALLDRQGFRAVLAVPLTREERTIGALLVVRKSPGAFAPEIVELLGTLATQSALAIQNARLYREIEEKSRELETASRHKSQFLASMSHELRTPLNAILGFNEMILDQVYGEVPPDVMAPLENIQSSGKHLLRLINNVLDLAKIEAGRMELALCDFSVQDTVASVHSTLQPLAAEKGLEFVAEVPADLPIAHGDPGRLAQCLMNLAGNSLKFTKQGRVAIGVARDNGVLRFSVADTGIGIPPDKIESLFTEFKQTDATVASEYGGTGLGLSITKKFIEMHGGKIWVESEPGKGSTFRFEIPLRAAQ